MRKELKKQLKRDLKEICLLALCSAFINVIGKELDIPSSFSIAIAIVIGCEIGKAFMKRED